MANMAPRCCTVAVDLPACSVRDRGWCSLLLRRQLRRQPHSNRQPRISTQLWKEQRVAAEVTASSMGYHILHAVQAGDHRCVLWVYVHFSVLLV